MNAWQEIKSPDEYGVAVDILLQDERVRGVQVRFTEGKQALVCQKAAIASEALDHWNQNPKRVFHLDASSWQKGEENGVLSYRTTVFTGFLESINLTVETDQNLRAKEQHNLLRLVLHTLKFQSEMQLLPGQVETTITGLHLALEGATPASTSAYRQQAQEAFKVKAVSFTEVTL